MSDLGNEEFRRAIARGRQLDLESAVELALRNSAGATVT